MSSEPLGDGIADSLQRGVLMGVALLVLVLPPVLERAPRPAQAMIPAAQAAQAVATAPRVADFSAVQDVQASADARHVAHWVAHSADNAGHEFVIVDKAHAQVHVFDEQARLRASTPVLLGSARGDHSVAGIGSRPLAEVRPEERTTPAGRFLGERGRSTVGEDVVWIDYGAAVSMHRVRATEPRERRLERLATPTAADNRISYGCINVPVAFYETHIRPVFASRRAVVYVLPEDRPVRDVFGSYEVASAVK